jgi:hypothetical protein
MLSLKDQELITEAKKTLNYEIDKDSDNRRDAHNDLEFITIKGKQWDDEVARERKLWGRPMLEVNVLHKYIDQVTGEMRMNKSKIDVIPADDDADIDQAKLRAGKIKEIEYNSSAKSIYDACGDGITECGYAAMQVINEYSKNNPFEQELKIKLIDDPINRVYLDSRFDPYHYDDAEYGFILTEYDKDRFKEEFPKADYVSHQGSGSDINKNLVMGEGVVVVEYFYKEKEFKTMVLLSDDRQMEKSEAEKEIQRLKDHQRMAIEQGIELTQPIVIPEILRERNDVEQCHVKYIKFVADDILERNDWPGTIIPISILHGKVRIIDGKRHICGLIRNAIDAQKMLNYWHTTAVESIALAPTAPVVMTDVMVEGSEGDWATSHKRNYAYLTYKPDPAQPGGPHRLEPSTPSPALFNELNRAENNIENTIGMHKADVGNAGRELSGNAIEARQLPGHVSTFVYQDNLIKGIERIGKILVDAMPKVYDNERTTRMLRDDGEEETTLINTTVGNALNAAQTDPKKYSGLNVDDLKEKADKEGYDADYNKMSKGKFRVVVTTGPSFETKRQEAAQRMLEFAQISGTMNPVDKYYYLKNADWEGSDELAEAVRKQIPYGVLPPRPGEKPPPPPQPDPAQQVELQIKMLDREVQRAKQINEAERLKTERVKQLKEALRIQQDAKESDVKINAEIARTIKEITKDIEDTPNEANKV